MPLRWLPLALLPLVACGNVTVPLDDPDPAAPDGGSAADADQEPTVGLRFAALPTEVVARRPFPLRLEVVGSDGSVVTTGSAEITLTLADGAGWTATRTVSLSAGSAQLEIEAPHSTRTLELHASAPGASPATARSRRRPSPARRAASPAPTSSAWRWPPR